MGNLEKVGLGWRNHKLLIQEDYGFVLVLRQDFTLDLPSLELRDKPASASQMVGLKARPSCPARILL